MTAKKPVAIVLANIRSSHNVGAIFRTADGVGVHEIFMLGYTPAPVDRFGHVNKEIAKTALGSEASVPWKRVRTWTQCKKLLREKGYDIVSIEQHPRSIPFKKFKMKRPTAFVFGNEVTGVPKAILDASSAVLDIPMRGKKESLNVSVAAGVILYSL
jgi:tRNA G18 (ribose-2'-O)-methylase SpoU